MKKHMGMITLAVIVVLLLLTMTAAFTCGSDEIVIVQTFGRTTRVYQRDQGAGLHFKWPWPFQTVVRYDARNQVFEDVLEQAYIEDGFNVIATSYCAWRIGDPVKFRQEFRTMDMAEDSIRDQLRAKKKDILGGYSMSQLVNTELERMLLAKIEREIRDAVSEYVRDKYGVEIVMVGIRGIGLPDEVTKSVIKSMQARVKEKIDDYEARGAAQAQGIRSRAKTAKEQILSFARHKSDLIRSQGDVYRAKAGKVFSEDPKLAIFLRRLKVLKAGLSGARLLLDANWLPQLEWFTTSPGDTYMEGRADEDGEGSAPGPGMSTKSPRASAENEREQ